MGLKRFFPIAFTTLVLIVSPPVWLNFPLLDTKPVLAQLPFLRKVEAYRLLMQGVTQLNTSQFQAAVQSFQAALSIYREIKDRQGEGWALGNLGNVYLSLGDYPKAVEYLQQVLAIARSNQDRESEGQALANLGTAYSFLGDYPKAIEHHQQALALARSIGDRATEGKVLGNLGLVYYSLADYPKAIEYYQQNLAIARSLQDRLGEGNVLGNLANTYDALADYPKAIDYHQQHLAITRSIQDRLGEGKTLGNLGTTYRNLGNYSKAIECQQQALEIAREIQDRASEEGVLNNLGNTYYSLGDYPKAIEYHQQALAIARAIQDREGEGQTLGNLGAAYNILGDYPKAIEYHQQALTVANGIKDRQTEEAQLSNLGNTYQNLSDYPKAIEYYQQALALARTIKDRQGEGLALGNLGAAYFFLGDNPKGISYAQQCLAIARAIQDSPGEGRALNNLGLALFKSGNLTPAETTLLQGIKVLESLRGGLEDNQKVSIFDTQTNTYQLLQQVFVAQNKPDAALEVAESGRARAFVELLTKRLSPNPTQSDKITSPNIEKIKQIAKQQNATLVQYSRVSDLFKVEGKPKIQESDLYIWVIKPTGEVTFRKADLKPLWQQQKTSLANLVTTIRDSIGVNDRSIFQVDVVNPTDPERQSKSLKEIHQLLIEPVADLLPTDPNQRVIFVPQGKLFLVPFPALQDREGKYLIEKHTILTAPSIQVLELTRASREKVKQAAVKQAIVVGNPTMPSLPPKYGEKPQQLSPLPGAKQEAEDIAPLLNTKALTGNEASKAAVLARLPQAKILHFATHGLFDDFQGLQSAIALAPTSSDNGLLTAEEILKLKLNADLVVLSACNTGRGRITGDGVIGLSRSLFIAGTPSVIVSLWSVPDTPTASLMTEFYTNLYQKKLDKAQALRMAMLKIMEKQRDNPKAWAAFTLIGEAD